MIVTHVHTNCTGQAIMNHLDTVRKQRHIDGTQRTELANLTKLAPPEVEATTEQKLDLPAVENYYLPEEATTAKARNPADDVAVEAAPPPQASPPHAQGTKRLLDLDCAKSEMPHIQCQDLDRCMASGVWKPTGYT